MGIRIRVGELGVGPGVGEGVREGGGRSRSEYEKEKSPFWRAEVPRIGPTYRWQKQAKELYMYAG